MWQNERASIKLSSYPSVAALVLTVLNTFLKELIFFYGSQFGFLSTS
jgi:hypothetical protein